MQNSLAWYYRNYDYQLDCKNQKYRLIQASIALNRWKISVSQLYIIFIKFDNRTMMQEQILGAEEDFEMYAESTSSDPKQKYFNEAVMCLQQAILDEQFQSTQTMFMKDNCDIETKSSSELQQLFNSYRSTISQLLTDKIKSQFPAFEFYSFAEAMKNRVELVDEEILEIVNSCVDISEFKTLLNDYKTAEEQEERYRVLTVKTNKLPENKKVKGNSQNIFGSSNIPTFGQPKNPSKKVTSSSTSEKTIDQVFVPETVLTVKGLRKC